MANKKLICFDVDGTLVEIKNSWAYLTKKLGCSERLISEVYHKTESGKMPFDEGVRAVEKMYFESGRASKENIVKILGGINLKRDAKDIADYLKESGYIIYLVSGGIDIYLEMIAKQIGADGFFGHASFIFDETGMLEKINYGHFRQGPVKAQRVCELSGKFGIPEKEIVFVGDSENDLEAFKITGRGIAIEPFSEILEPVVWKTVRSLSEIKDILK